MLLVVILFDWMELRVFLVRMWNSWISHHGELKCQTWYYNTFLICIIYSRLFITNTGLLLLKWHYQNDFKRSNLKKEDFFHQWNPGKCTELPYLTDVHVLCISGFKFTFSLQFPFNFPLFVKFNSIINVCNKKVTNTETFLKNMYAIGIFIYYSVLKCQKKCVFYVHSFFLFFFLLLNCISIIIQPCAILMHYVFSIMTTVISLLVCFFIKLK